MNLGEFIDTFKDAISRRVVESYPPLYRPSENEVKLPHLLRTPLGAQADAIRTVACAGVPAAPAPWLALLASLLLAAGAHLVRQRRPA